MFGKRDQLIVNYLGSVTHCDVILYPYHGKLKTAVIKLNLLVWLCGTYFYINY